MTLWFAWALFSIGAAAALANELVRFSQPTRRRWRRRLAVFNLIAIAAATFLTFPQDSSTRDAVEAIAENAARQAVDALDCTLDSLKRLNAKMERENASFQKYKREYAECFSAFAQSEFEIAFVKMGVGEYDSALTILKHLAGISQDDSGYVAALLFYIGNCYFFLREHDSAVASYDSALNLKRDSPDVWVNRALLLETKGHFGEALASLDSAKRYREDDATSLSNRGAVLRRMGRSSEALASFDSAVKLEPTRSELWYNHGTTLLGLGRTAEALASLDSSLKYESGFALMWYNRAVALFKLERFEEAARSCDSALSCDPPYSEAHKLREKALSRVR